MGTKKQKLHVQSDTLSSVLDKNEEHQTASCGGSDASSYAVASCAIGTSLKNLGGGLWWVHAATHPACRETTFIIIVHGPVVSDRVRSN